MWTANCTFHGMHCTYPKPSCPDVPLYWLVPRQSTLHDRVVSEAHCTTHKYEESRHLTGPDTPRAAAEVDDAFGELPRFGRSSRRWSRTSSPFYKVSWRIAVLIRGWCMLNLPRYVQNTDRRAVLSILKQVPNGTKSVAAGARKVQRKPGEAAAEGERAGQVGLHGHQGEVQCGRPHGRGH